MRISDLRSDGIPQIYRPFWLDNPIQLTVLARAADDAAVTLSSIQEISRRLGANRPVHGFQPLEQLLGEALAATRFTLALLALFAVIAVLLSAVGLYGVVSYSVSSRTREIGVRMAVGADARRILRMVLGRGAALAAAGAALGLAGALLLTRYLSSLLYGVTARDPVTYGLLAALLIGLALAASLVPARRATRVDPVTALRAE